MAGRAGGQRLFASGLDMGATLPARRRGLHTIIGSSRGDAMIVDAWMQHGSVRFLRHEMLDSLWRWTGQKPPDEEVPVSVTVGAMDAGGVDVGLISAWYGPEGALVSNDEV